MNISIEENGCVDPEVRLLDTKLPYFYARVRDIFVFEPEQVCVKIVSSKEDFCAMKGEDSDCELGAFIKDNTIYIFQPNQFGVLTKTERKDFYRILYQELTHLFYQVNTSAA
tara:strand:+ start:5836 stop:6171 length:336 start_codon:yes stop_codon:yes gene_type:complete